MGEEEVAKDGLCDYCRVLKEERKGKEMAKAPKSRRADVAKRRANVAEMLEEMCETLLEIRDIVLDGLNVTAHSENDEE